MGCTTISISTFIKDLYLPKNIFKKNFKDKKQKYSWRMKFLLLLGI